MRSTMHTVLKREDSGTTRSTVSKEIDILTGNTTSQRRADQVKLSCCIT